MATYVVMEPPGADGAEAAMRAVYVRDGFHFLAFVIPVVWLLWHRLWIEGILVFAAGLGVAALGDATGYPALGGAVALFLSIYVGLEGSALRINALRRRGWRECGVVEAGNDADAEIRHLADDREDLSGSPARPSNGSPNGSPVGPWQPTQPAAFGRPAAAVPALGLLRYPGRH